MKQNHQDLYEPDVYTSKDSLDALGVDMNDISSALLDAYDIRNALSKKIKNQPKDSDGTETTIGDCLDSIIEFLENLEIGSMGDNPGN